jgi:hypothetical protein
MYQTNNNVQSGQSFTLDVHDDKKTGETVVTCPGVPDVGEVRDKDGRYAVQHMKRLLDDHVHRGYQQERTPMVLSMPDGDTGE